MGVMRFLVHPPDVVYDWPEASLAYISTLDGRIQPTRSEIEGNLLCCRRSTSDSGKMSVPWPVQGYGRPVVTTASLSERDAPYLLPLELARGKLGELRDQAASWELARMVLPQAYKDHQREAFRAFSHASSLLGTPERAAQFAQVAIEKAFEAAEILIGAYVLQRVASMKKSANHAPGLIGCTLDSYFLTPEGHALGLELFDAGSIPFHWTTIESAEGNYDWSMLDQLVERCASNRLLIRGGPIIDLGPQGLPSWLTPWKSDFLNLPSFVCDFVESVISRYTGLIRVWEVATAGNTGGAFELSEEHRLALVARIMEAAVRTDSDSQLFIRVEQPWGEYQRRGTHRLSPYQFVDALVRSNLGLTGVTLDINNGYTSRACLSRDLLSMSRLIDLWSSLGIQLQVNLVCPSSPAKDLRADEDQSVEDNVWKQPWSEEAQAEWTEHAMALLLAKPAVTGVFLSQFSDADHHRYPHGGLVRRDGAPKPLADSIRRLQYAK